MSGGEEEEGEKQVTVKFARQESDRVKKAREQSYKFLSKKSAEEKWYETKYHSSTSHLAEVNHFNFAMYFRVKRREGVKFLSTTLPQLLTSD